MEDLEVDVDLDDHDGDEDEVRRGESPLPGSATPPLIDPPAGGGRRLQKGLQKGRRARLGPWSDR